MKKKTANSALLSIAFLWSTQYIFFSNIPEEISSFAFLALTNIIGFLLTLVLFPKSLYRLTKKIVWHSLLLGSLLFLFNIMLISGSRMIDYTNSAFLASAYIVFIPVIFIFFGKKVTRNSIYAIIITLFGIFLGTDAYLTNFTQTGCLFVLIADFFFALYMVIVGIIAKKDDPLILSIGQMFFVAFFSFIAWMYVQPSTIMQLPTNGYFWVDVFAIAVFIRSYSTIMQIYAQRQVSAINASLIFSMEIVFTIIASTFLPGLLGDENNQITPINLLACLFIILGIIVSEGLHNSLSHQLFKKKKSEKTID